MKKVLLGALVLFALLIVACDNDIEPDVPSVSDYDFISFQDDNYAFEVNQGDSSTHPISIYSSRISSSDRVIELAVVPLDPNDPSQGTNIDASLYTVPASVIIPANQSSVEFDVTITDDGLDSSSRLVLDFANSVTDLSPHSIVMGIEIVCPINELLFDITFDNYAEETSWELYDLNGVSPVLLESGGGYGDLDDQTIQIRLCIGSGNFGFVIYDAYSDGICCNFGSGSYSLTLNGEEFFTGGSFGANEATSFTAP
ncbi:hypothetical protein [uncultured Winogradskyella sp.]|uniref:hypothetical protein n=1 Tax=uncultured Winogradskyella sp. TaxID=395353 RepID=UPI002622C550|nr:hypothetical protein [uncultured Winogradskyella sp.]